MKIDTSARAARSRRRDRGRAREVRRAERAIDRLYRPAEAEAARNGVRVAYLSDGPEAMAAEGRDDLRNPYYGSQMLTCGSFT